VAPVGTDCHFMSVIQTDGVPDSMFNQQEVQKWLGGVNSPVDLEDLRKHTKYGALYDDSEALITAFWNVNLPVSVGSPNWSLTRKLSGR
jgi:hypothetical protein